MKTLSRTFVFIGSAVIVLITILSCQTHPQYALKRPHFIFGHPDAHPREYVELKKGVTEDTFRQRLATLKKNGGDCQIYFLSKPVADGGKEIFNYCDQISSLKTDRVMRSKAARDAKPESSTANDPHATYRIASPYQVDIDAVKALLNLP